jgi:hypothetical protein
MNRRSVLALLAVLVLGAIAIAGAASPTGRARGLSYADLSPIQKKLVSGAFQQALGPITTGASSSAPTAHAATSSTCGTGGGGDEPDEADSCPPDSYTPVGGGAGPGGGGGGPGGDQNYFPSGNNGCDENQGDNVKVNQNCENVSDAPLQGRGEAQNEEAIAVDPNNPNHFIASQNDYRRGDGNCYGAYSLDGGHSWADTTIPMSFSAGATSWGKARQYWQAGGDTSVAWDTKGNAYFMCQVFNRGAGVSPNPDQSSAFYLFRSTGNDGASTNFAGRPVAEESNNTSCCLLDKEYMTIDDTVGSPFQDRIYVTWTNFAADGTAYIYEAFSNDYGQHFSSPHVVSADSPLCTYTYGAATPQGKCNENQFSNPFVGPDGSLYVAWANYNLASDNTGEGTTPGTDNRYEVLLAKSTDGGNTFSAPVKVADFYDLPDCLTYQGSDPGRACVPEKGPTTTSVFRATNYPVGSVNPKDKNQVVVTIGSYINQHSKEAPTGSSKPGCVPSGFNASTGQPLYSGVKPGPCNNDILISVSTDGGATFTGTTTDPRQLPTVNQDPDQATTDQWFQWSTFTKDGKLAVDYYDRQYGDKGKDDSAGIPSDEWTGSSDITLSGSKDLVKFGSERITSSSMPPPTQFYANGGQFYGDYIGMDTTGGDALPIWSDTRDPALFLCPGSATPTTPPAICTSTYSNGVTGNDENSYMARSGVPTK